MIVNLLVILLIVSIPLFIWTKLKPDNRDIEVNSRLLLDREGE